MPAFSTHHVTRWVVAVFIIAAGAGRCRADAATQPADMLTADGPIKGLCTKVNGVIILAPDGRKLQIDPASWVKSPVNAARPIRFAPGAPGVMPAGGGFGGPMPPAVKDASAIIGNCSTSSSSGANGSSLTAYNDKLSFSLVTGNNALTFELREVGAPYRHLLVRDDGAGALSLTYLHPDGDMVMFTQSRGGGVRLIAARGDNIETGRGADYRDLTHHYAALISTRLVPALAFLGIVNQNPIDNPAIRAAVLRSLVSANPDSQKDADRLLASLDAADFDVREHATKELDQGYGEFGALIEAKLKDDTITAEAKQRLQAISEAHKDDSKVLAQVAALDLANDPVFLVALLDTTDERDKPKVIARLEGLSGQKLGADPAAWRKWLDARNP